VLGPSPVKAGATLAALLVLLLCLLLLVLLLCLLLLLLLLQLLLLLLCGLLLLLLLVVLVVRMHEDGCALAPQSAEGETCTATGRGSRGAEASEQGASLAQLPPPGSACPPASFCRGHSGACHPC